jgi:hypothetical protein
MDGQIFKLREATDKKQDLASRQADYAYGAAAVGRDLFDPFQALDVAPALKATRPVFRVLAAGGNVLAHQLRHNLPVRFEVKVTKKKKVTPNESSIQAVLQWPDNHISYFCGGDGNPKLTVEYFKNQHVEGPGIDLMKLDHHGSRKEFKQGALVQLLKPARILITPGYQYGHPCA